MLTTLAIAFTAALAQEPAPAAPPAPAAIAQPAAALIPKAAPAEDGEEDVAFRFTVVPGIGWNAQPDATVDGFSTGFVGQAAAVDGVDAQLGLSIVEGRVDGVQASVGLSMAEEIDGLQLSSMVNLVDGEVRVGQLSGAVNVAGGDVVGLQGAGFVNIAGGNVHGVQAAAAVNIAGGEQSEGVQASGGVNIADGIEGIQAAPVNIAETVEGAQAGVLNIGGDVDGLQIGVINVARTSKVSIAPLNFIGDGLHRVDVWSSESAVVSGGLKFGSKHVYTLLAAGWVGEDQPWWTWGGGFGVHIQHDRLWAEIDDSVWASPAATWWPRGCTTSCACRSAPTSSTATSPPSWACRSTPGSAPAP